jgi:hypothetical protein
MLRTIVFTLSFTCLAVPGTAQNSAALRDPASFADIKDQAARSRA